MKQKTLKKKNVHILIVSEGALVGLCGQLDLPLVGSLGHRPVNPVAGLPARGGLQKEKIVKDRPVDPVAGLPQRGDLHKNRRALKIARLILLLAFLPGEAYT